MRSIRDNRWDRGVARAIKSSALFISGLLSVALDIRQGSSSLLLSINVVGVVGAILAFAAGTNLSAVAFDVLQPI